MRHLHYGTLAFAASASLAVLAGCSSAGTSPAVGPASQAARIAARPDACAAPINTISEDVSQPRDIAFDRDGDLLVANTKANNVTVYQPGRTTPNQTIDESIKHPTALAFDTSGNLYVANRGDNFITIYGPGKYKFKGEIGQGVTSPEAL
ncbi:MAG TPA: hypothetical protein VGF18_04510, partial [Candidatus Tumulicola sp.]